jgi:ferredoxin
MILSVRSLSTVKITYIEADGTEKVVDAEVGKNLMEVAHDHNVELEGACGGELACSTCHLIFEKEIYDTLPAKAEEEDDMLDLAFEVTET